ncbi:asparagine synthase (glutamine-hydrolyzing) [Rhizobium sp. BK376]|uniref:asparagine synthase (glutamine-hydrolyzing) n=1 Tax=Rhizobium sp. BK376 TaxID=2512149 RepID=UPI0010472389|nr:asparagine synthase (glutamine-hydrolyzing) [Rhizobium sp. BK376]TCR73234.1 asparagine synthase (glutamine-hydrolysing) [Rhizobium sp. BK376]
MCGILGYFGDGMAAGQAAALLRRMAGSLLHRGPDEGGIFTDDGAGFGHRRLSIVGLADGQQPMPNSDGSLCISFNGEIFNYVELRRSLEAKGRRFRTSSDTEVILHLYEEMGPGCVDLLNGDFVFAIWDRNLRRMFIARDRMGVRPLFYTQRDGMLFFASEIKALLEVPGVKADIDPFALDQVFTFWAPVPPRTIFKGVSELPAGHLMIVDGNGISVRQYWDLSFPDKADVEPARREDDVAEELLALLDDATAIRMRADVPVGAYLSGGLDSSITCALAKPYATAGLRTFSVTFDTAEHDESPFQQEMVKALGTHHSAVACGPDEIAGIFPSVIEHTEKPIIRTAPAPLHLLARHVREEGMKVVLTGEGADEVFAGYDIFKETRVRRFCSRQTGSKRRPLLFRRLYPYLPGLSQQTPESLAAFFGAGNEDVSDPLFSHRPRYRSTAAAKIFFSADLRKTLAGYDATEEVLARLPADFGRWHPLHQAQYLETKFLLSDYILSSQGDRMSMAHGIEGRFPFLDHRLVEFAAKIPPGMKLKGFVEKHILRRAVADLLPPSIGQRTKQPYRAPDSRSFFAGREPDYVGQLFSHRALEETGLFNPVAAEKLLAKCRRETDGFRDNAAFVGILSTQLWHEAFTKRTVNQGDDRQLAAAI